MSLINNVRSFARHLTENNIYNVERYERKSSRFVENFFKFITIIKQIRISSYEMYKKNGFIQKKIARHIV